MLAYAVLITYYHNAWNAAPGIEEHMRLPVTADGTRVSVIVALRNEAENVEVLLTSLLNQGYPRNLTEIILVDDHSTDNTWQLISAYDEPGYITTLKLEAQSSGDTGSFKKSAISQGINHATGVLIVTTDADCRFPSTWLSSLVHCHENTRAKFIAAPVRYADATGLLAVFETLDFLTLQGVTGASVSKRRHTMCNGANLAYTKQVFLEVNGFEGIDHIPSGDDMLLMYKIFSKYPQGVVYLKSAQAMVTTKGADSWRSFFNQRIRWSSKAAHYDDKLVFRILLLVYLVNICFLVAAVASFFKTNYAIFFLLMLVAKTLVEFPFVNSVAMFFGQQRLMRYFPFMQPLHIVYTIVAGWLGKFGSYEWKGRKIVTHGKSS
jgi:poly-beta-1,6-N-acetyl-D-glucosamine synthase